MVWNDTDFIGWAISHAACAHSRASWCFFCLLSLLMLLPDPIHPPSWLPLVLVVHLYTRSLVKVGDDGFYSSTDVRPESTPRSRGNGWTSRSRCSLSVINKPSTFPRACRSSTTSHLRSPLFLIIRHHPDDGRFRLVSSRFSSQLAFGLPCLSRDVLTYKTTLHNL